VIPTPPRRDPGVILTVDLGTSVTKVVVWEDGGQVAVGRSALQCNYTDGNRAEQDPASWWPSVVAACARARSALGSDAARVFGAVEALGFAAARQTFVAVTADATPLGPALLWSDRRARDEAMELARSFGDEGAETVRRRTGVVLDGGSVAAKVAWLERHEPETLKAARWLLAPRDFIAWRLTGVVSTDDTLASATGLFTISDGHVGSLLAGLVDDVADRVPLPVVSTTVLGGLLAGPAAELGLRAGIDVVIGAGDRACEVIGAHASETWPMVSWGTTANVSVPVSHLAGGDVGDGAAVPQAMIVTRGALGGWLLEGGLSAAGSLIGWLAALADSDADSVMERARSSPPGSRGVIVLPWFGGARAPWWRDTARGAVVGLSLEHGVGDVARAVVESVAWDVLRCLESARESQAGAVPVGLVLAGGGANIALWTEILTSVTGLPARRSRSGEAASAGAAVLVARATGIGDGDGDGVEPDLGGPDLLEDEVSPDRSLTACYTALRPTVESAAAAVIELGA
jgi:xylulokinase